MTQKITSRFYPDTEYNNSVLLIFQIGNYMFAGGNANYYMIGANHILPNSREGAPYITNGHTMVPIRSVIEGLGGTVGWDPDLNGARCTLNGITITMPIGSEYAYINGEPFKMTTPAIVKNGRTMIPIRFVAESLGYEVDYISDGAFVVIKQKKNAESEGYDFSYPDYFEFDEDQRDWVGYEIYRYKDLDIGVRIVEADVYDPNFMDDITDEMSNDLEERQMPKAQNHKLVVNSRKNSMVTGVLDVSSFDLNEILLETEQGMLMVKGTDMHVNRLNLEKGEVDLSGNIDSIACSQSHAARGQGEHFFAKLFG